MSTLTETEAAVEALPDADRDILMQRLAARTRQVAREDSKLVMEDGFAVLVAPPGAPEMTPELVKALRDDFP